MDAGGGPRDAGRGRPEPAPGRPIGHGRRRWRALNAVGLVVLGVALTSVSLGVGLPHLAEPGVRAGDVVGLVSLVVGGGALLAGTVGVVRATPGWWRLVVAPALVVAVLAGGYVLAVPLAAAVPARSPVQRSPAVAADEVIVPTVDGVELAGWFASARGRAAVVLLPGAGSSRDAVVDHLAVLHDGGYHVLALDPRGHGASTGRGMDWGWYGEADVTAAVDYLTGREDVDADRIAVVGLSMGGEQAIGAAGADERIRGVVAEGVTARTARDLHWLSDVYGWRGAVTEALEHARTAVADLVSPAHQPPPLRQAAAAAAPRPVLLITAGAVPDEQHAAADIQAASPDNVTVWTVPGADHVAGLRTDPQAWTAQVLHYLDDVTG
ncbi:alpha/beta hydrolase [Georgenia sp. H159]|uniref:alpha/beta hydrolase n=1 Tax=Georgenia sp. H159 TaxID=3076115 RepID=UPI002D77D352|nr:alpha/beta fold hydrolase [Georgenia sp. H159]